MKFSTSVVALLAASVVQAQTLPNIPLCSLSCFFNALLFDGCAGLTDFKCHCAKPELISKITPCVAAACSAADQATVAQQVMDTCAAAGVPITLTVPGATTTASGPVVSPRRVHF